MKKILLGDVVLTGGMPAESDMVQIGRTYKGTANFTTEADTIKDFWCEEEPGVPVDSITTEFGLKNLVFNVLEWDNESLVRIFGGATKPVTAVIDGESRTVEKYVPPANAVEIEQALRAISLRKTGIDIPRAKIMARFIWALTREEIAQIEITARALAPFAATDGAYEVYSIPEPVQA